MTTKTTSTSYTSTMSATSTTIVPTCNPDQLRQQICDNIRRGNGTLVNGNFETRCPGFPDQSGQNAFVKCLLGWRTTAPDGNFEIWSDGFNSVPADSKPYFVELNAHYVSTLYQDLAVVPGQVINWSIKHRGRNGNDTMQVQIGAPGSERVQGNYTDGTAAWGYHNGSYVVP
jgi:hypothetical protein